MELAVAGGVDFLFLLLQLDLGARALEIEARANLFGAVVPPCLILTMSGFGDGVKAGHKVREELGVESRKIVTCPDPILPPNQAFNGGVSLQIEVDVNLKAYNTFGLPAVGAAPGAHPGSS